MTFYIRYKTDFEKVALSHKGLKFIMTDKYIKKYFPISSCDIYVPFSETNYKDLIFIDTLVKIVLKNKIKLRFKEAFPVQLKEFIESSLFIEHLNQDLDIKEAVEKRKI
jgi:hypothetical protein